MPIVEKQSEYLSLANRPSIDITRTPQGMAEIQQRQQMQQLETVALVGASVALLLVAIVYGRRIARWTLNVFLELSAYGVRLKRNSSSKADALRQEVLRRADR